MIRDPIDLDHDLISFKKQFREILENAKSVGKLLKFLINLETTYNFFKLASKLYHNQFSV
jgi:hypothetical protein